MKHYLFICIAVLVLSGAQTALAESWTQINGSAPPAISGHTLVSIDNTVYLFGGKNSTVETNSRTANARGNTLNDLWQYTAGNKLWSKKETSNPPAPRNHHTAVALDGKMYVHGGLTSSGAVLWTCGNITRKQEHGYS